MGKWEEEDGRGIVRGDHFLPHKFIKRTFERWVNSTKQLLNAGRGHQAPRKAAHSLWKEVGKNINDKKRDKRGRDGALSREGSLKKERSFQTPGNTLTAESVVSLGTTEGNISSVAQSCPTLCDPMNRSTPGLPVHHQHPEFTQTHVHWVSDAIQPYEPLLSILLLPPIPPSIRVFSNESTLHMRWPKYWSFSFSIIPYKEIPGVISFRMDWLDLRAVQGTLKSSSTPQFKSINSLALSFLNSPTLTSIHDHWKNHSLD